MKTIFIFYLLLSALAVHAQDTTLLKKDRELINEKLVRQLRVNKTDVAKIESELFFVIINVKDSVFSSAELFSINDAQLKSVIENQLPKLLDGFKFNSCKDQKFIMHLVFINSNKYNDKYMFLKDYKTEWGSQSYYLGGMIFSIGASKDFR